MSRGRYTFGEYLYRIIFAGFKSEINNGNSGAAKTIDWTYGNRQKVTLTNNCTLTFTEPQAISGLLLKVVQDATGSRTITLPSEVKWPSGTVPTLTTTAGHIDLISLYYDGTNYFGQSSLDYTV